MKKTAFKIAASTLICSLTLGATATQSIAMRRAGGSDDATPTGQETRQLHTAAVRAVQQGQLSEALDLMEQAVGQSPQDAGYRLLLADIYLKQGRLESARATYGDVLSLDPANVRAGLSYALTQIALGRPQAAIAQLDAMSGTAPAADVGLAYALAGLPERAVEVLEPVARSHNATPRVRQNLALSYALAGDWRRARAVASQDISPADLPARMEQWASFARPGSAAVQVASLLNVTPVEDAGQPIRLALSQPSPETQTVQFAAAEAPAQPVQFAEAAPAALESDWGLPAQAEAPVQMAEVVQVAADAPVADEAPSVEQVQYALAAQTLNSPAPELVRTASASRLPEPAFRRPAPELPQPRAGNSRFVVQLGAFSNEGNAERAAPVRHDPLAGRHLLRAAECGRFVDPLGRPLRAGTQPRRLSRVLKVPSGRAVGRPRPTAFFIVRGVPGSAGRGRPCGPRRHVRPAEESPSARDRPPVRRQSPRRGSLAPGA